MTLYNFLVVAATVVFSSVQANNNTAEISMYAFPSTTVAEGSSVIIVCDTNLDFATDTLNIIHNTTESRVLLSINPRGTTCVAELESENMKCSNTIRPLTINITNVRMDQGGEYVCEITKPLYNESGSSKRATLTLDVDYPQLGPPLCSEASVTDGSDLIRNIGDIIEAMCSSVTSDKSVALSWTSSPPVELNYTSSVDESTGRVASTLKFTLDSRHDGIVLTCLRNTTDLLNVNDSTCSIGPFKLPATTTETVKVTSPSVQVTSSEQGFPFGAAIAIIAVSALLVIAIPLVIAVLIRSGRCRCNKSSDNESNDIPWYENTGAGAEPPEAEDSKDGHIYTNMETSKVRFINITPDEGLKTYPSPPNYPVPERIPQRKSQDTPYMAYETPIAGDLPTGDDGKCFYANTQSF